MGWSSGENIAIYALRRAMRVRAARSLVRKVYMRTKRNVKGIQDLLAKLAQGRYYAAQSCIINCSALPRGLEDSDACSPGARGCGELCRLGAACPGDCRRCRRPGPAGCGHGR